MAAAIDFAKNDPELSLWFEQHQIFQTAIQVKLRQIEPPGDLKRILLAREKVFLPGRLFWRRPLFLSAAATVVILVAALAALSPHTMAPDRFGNYREVMVSKALRGYIMEWDTRDMRRLRELVAGRKALANYELTKGLLELQLMGGAVFPWRSNPVTMVCFSRRDAHMVFLFVMNKAAVKDAPPSNPILVKVSELSTASWTHADTTYVLAGPDDASFANY